MPGPQSGSVPILRMYGVTAEGNSVCTHVHGFMPYLYVPVPHSVFTPENCRHFQDALQSAILSDSRSGRDNQATPVLAVEIVHKCSLYGYHQKTGSPFLLITLSLPRFVAPAKRLLEQGIDLPGLGTRMFQVFESNIEYEVRFMIDTNVVGCNWIECPPGKYFLRKPHPPHSTTTTPGGFTIYSNKTPPTSKCQIELDISYEDFMSHAPEGEWQKIAPLRILSFDIECAGRKGVFPEASQDSVIQIANMVVHQGDSTPFIRNVFTLKSCATIIGSDVRCFDNENRMLQVKSHTNT